MLEPVMQGEKLIVMACIKRNTKAATGCGFRINPQKMQEITSSMVSRDIEKDHV